MLPLLRVRRGLQLLLAVVRGYLADDGTTWASATAFYLILSLPPLLIAATSIAVGIVGQEAAGDWVLDQVVALLPAERSLVERLVAASLDGGRTAGVLSIVLLALTGSRVFGTL